MESKSWTSGSLIKWSILIVAGLLALLLLWELRELLTVVGLLIKAVLAPFVAALIMAYLLHPLVNLLVKRRVPRGAAVGLVFAAFVAIITVAVINLAPIFERQLASWMDQWPSWIASWQNWLDQIQENRTLPEAVQTALQRAQQRLETNISAKLSQWIEQIDEAVNVLFIIFILPFIVFYMLKDFPVFEKMALKWLPRHYRKKTLVTIQEVDRELGKFIRSQITVGIIVGMLALIGYSIIGLPYPLILASLVAITNIIPLIGPLLGAIPAVLIGATISWKLALFTIAINFLVQMIEGQVLSPLVVSRSTLLHPLLILLILAIGGQLFGFIGLLLAVPVALVIRTIWQQLRDPEVG